MVKKDLTVRERRKIYEDAIYVVAQTHKIAEVSPLALKERSVRTMINKQTDRCVSILATVLGYNETIIVGEDESKKIVMVTMDEDAAYTMDKKKFEEIVQMMPANKEVRETMWKALVKRDKKAKGKFDALIA